MRNVYMGVPDLNEYIEVKPERLKEIQLDMLEYFDSLCINNNLTYMLAYGTLLGAVRHKGYIPWDDDIDVWMPRADFMRLNQIMSQDETYIFRHITSDSGCIHVFGKIVNKNTILIEDENGNSDLTGIYIDVFPLDNQGNTKILAKCLLSITKLLTLMKNYKLYNSFPLNKGNGLVRRFLYFVSKMMPVGFYVIAEERVAQIFNKADTITKFYGCNVDPMYHHINEKEMWEGISRGCFEGKQFYIPNRWDDILRDLYGDYQKLPPESKRVSHHKFVAYERK